MSYFVIFIVAADDVVLLRARTPVGIMVAKSGLQIGFVVGICTENGILYPQSYWNTVGIGVRIAVAADVWGSGGSCGASDKYQTRILLSQHLICSVYGQVGRNRDYNILWVET